MTNRLVSFRARFLTGALVGVLFLLVITAIERCSPDQDRGQMEPDRVAAVGLILARSLWAMAFDDPLGLESREAYQRRMSVPSSVFSSATAYFRFCIEQGHGDVRRISTQLNSDTTTSEGSRSASALTQTNVFWSVVADRDDNYPVHAPLLISRNIRLNSLSEPAFVTRDTDLGIDYGVIVYFWTTRIVRASSMGELLYPGLTNRVLNP